MRLTLPLPPRALSPNARAHWAQKARAARRYRTRSMVLARIAGHPYGWARATVEITWYAKTATHPDPDNALASLKAALDGIMSAGVLTDDRELRFEPIRFAKDRDNPRVELAITPLAELRAIGVAQ